MEQRISLRTEYDSFVLELRFACEWFSTSLGVNNLIRDFYTHTSFSVLGCWKDVFYATEDVQLFKGHFSTQYIIFHLHQVTHLGVLISINKYTEIQTIYIIALASVFTK